MMGTSRDAEPSDHTMTAPADRPPQQPVPPARAARVRVRAAVFVALVLAAACARPAATAGGPPRSIPALKLAVLDAVGGHLDYCDPDQYPIAHGTPIENAKARFPTIEADKAAFAAILSHEHLTAGQPFTDAELIAINQDYKQMQAIDLHPSGDGYRFTVSVPAAGTGNGSQSISGTVSRTGPVTIQSRGPGQPKQCPICLAAGDLIATPGGPVAVPDIQVGMRVWTTDLRGRRIVGVVLATGHMMAPIGHEVVRLTLADGRTVLASPAHPTGDGRLVGALRPGDRLDGSVVVGAALVPYTDAATYDLLPSGPTGTYFANGVLLGSTLRAAATGPARRPA